MENQIEIWKDIPEYEGSYQVSSLCRFKSLSRGIVNNAVMTESKEFIMKKMKGSNGYYSIEFYKDNKRKRFLCHKLFAKSFMPNPKSKPFINHINGLKTDNTIDNLEWCTSSENNRHAFYTGLRIMPSGEKNSQTKLNESKVLAIRRLYRLKPGTSKIKLAKKLNVTIGAIYGILKGRPWKHLI